MNETKIKEIIRQNLPEMLAQDPLVRDFVLRTVSSYYAVKSEGHWCSLIKGEKRYGVRLRGNGEIIKT